MKKDLPFLPLGGTVQYLPMRIVGGLGILLLLVLGLVGVSRQLIAPAMANIGYLHLATINHLEQAVGQRPQLSESERWFQLALAQDQQNVRARYGLGRTYTFQGRYAKAVQVLERGVETQPGDALVHLALGDAYDGAGNRERAIREWQIDEVKSVLFYRGREYEQARDWAEAAYWYMAAVEVDPNWAASYHRLGVVLRAQGMITDAIQSLQRAASITPEDPFVHHQLGLIYMSQGQSNLAIDEFEQVLQTLPDDMWTTIYLASLYLEQDNLDRAAHYAQRASAQSQHPRPHFILGTVYHRQGLVEEACVELAEAVRLAPIWNSASPHKVSANEVVKYQLALAEAYSEAGQIENAMAVYQAVLAQDPANALAAEALQKLQGERRSP